MEQEGMAKLSANAAGERNFEVYMGVDVFGRNTFGGGGFDVGFLLSVLVLCRLKFFLCTCEMYQLLWFFKIWSLEVSSLWAPLVMLSHRFCTQR